MGEVSCPNCGTIRTNRYCAICGQNDRDYSQPLRQVLGDITRELFDFDSRVAQTFKGILLHPGKLTREFSENRRASYVTPFRLYLFTSLVCFFVLSINVGLNPGRIDEGSHRVTQPSAETIEERQRQLAEVTDEQVDRAIGSMAPQQRSKAREILQRDGSSRSKMSLLGIVQNAPTEIGSWYSVVLNVVVEVLHSPGDVIEELVENLPFMMFVLMPWFSSLLALFYIRQHRTFLHHFVFALHVHSFAFVMLTIIILIPQPAHLEAPWVLLAKSARTVFSLVLLVHTFIAFKQFYSESLLATTSKFVGILFAYQVMLLPAFLLVVAITFRDLI